MKKTGEDGAGMMKGRPINESMDTSTAEDETGGRAVTEATGGTEDARGQSWQPAEQEQLTEPTPEDGSPASLPSFRTQTATRDPATRKGQTAQPTQRNARPAGGGPTGLRLETALAGRSHSDEEVRQDLEQTGAKKSSKAKAVPKDHEKALTKDGRLMPGMVLSWALVVGLGLGMLVVFAFHNVRESGAHGKTAWRSRQPCALCSDSFPLGDPLRHSPKLAVQLANLSRASLNESPRPEPKDCQPPAPSKCSGPVYLTGVADWRRCQETSGGRCVPADDGPASPVSEACWRSVDDRFVRSLGPGLWLIDAPLVSSAGDKASSPPPPSLCPSPNSNPLSSSSGHPSASITSLQSLLVSVLLLFNQNFKL